jgi:hypothetical protein
LTGVNFQVYILGHFRLVRSLTGVNFQVYILGHFRLVRSLTGVNFQVYILGDFRSPNGLGGGPSGETSAPAMLADALRRKPQEPTTSV